MPYPDYIDKNPKIIFFTDFDGTVTREDCLDWLVETEGYGPEKLRQSNQGVVEGKLQFGDASREQIDSIKTPFNKCVEKLLDYVELDDYFVAFYKWTVSASVPIVVLSSGITPMIKAVLAKLIGSEAQDVEVTANAVVPLEGFKSINEDGGAWRVHFRDDSVYGHDKARTITPYAVHRDKMKEGVKPILMYAGDGVSDLSAAKETELLFAKEGKARKDLAVYCKREGIPFTEFRDWKDILEITQDVYYGRKSIDQVVQESLHIAQKKDSCIDN